jgi:phosphotransferase system enzyme I (PtsI)
MPLKRGIGISAGVVIGEAVVLEANDLRIPRRTVPPQQIPQEIALVDEIFQSARNEIGQEREQFAARAGTELADIFGFHESWLGDPKPRKEIAVLIETNAFGAPYAISTFMRSYRKRFEQMASPFLQERAKDVLDIERRLLRHASGQIAPELSESTQPMIVIAHDLTPSQTVMLEKTGRLLGFAIDAGGATSHTAIIAAGLGIPAVVGLEDITAHVSTGDQVIIDGLHGIVVVHPDEPELREYAARAVQLRELRDTLEQLRDLPAETKDGCKIELLGNIEFPYEVDGCLARGATGIGLFRTEFLFMQEGGPPDEHEQYDAYCAAIKSVNGKPLVIRTLDLGGDKFQSGVTWEMEKNPFLGLRSIRYSLQHLTMFRPQLRAIVRASAHGDVRIMFPLISRIMELRQAKFVLSLVMEELEEEGVEFRGSIPVGVMVETPAAAICARELARETDFLSIGTNDLIQYTLAVDRTNERVAQLYTPADPSILRLIRSVIRCGDRAGIAVSLCGEMAGDPLFTILLVGLGLRTLSMAGANIPRAKKIIRSISLSDAQKVRQRVMSFETEREVLNYLRDETRKVWGDI